MATAFQQSAFQDNAFQIDEGQVVFQTPAAGIGKGGRVAGREPKIRWPKRKSKQAVAEVVAEALAEVPVEEVPREIDVGLLATNILETQPYEELRRIETYSQMIPIIMRELAEMDDEDAILLLF